MKYFQLDTNEANRKKEEDWILCRNKFIDIYNFFLLEVKFLISKSFVAKCTEVVD